MHLLSGSALKKEMTQRKSRRETLLDTLKKRGIVTTKELESFGTGVSSRIKELRKGGHIIVTSYIEPGLYQYSYLGERENDGTNVSVID